MNLRLLRLLFLVAFLCPLVDAQQGTGDGDEMRFVEAMRKGGYGDLALQYLEGLKKKPISKELASELPVEIARTRLSLAADEADSAKKQATYAEVRGELAKFLKANPASRLAPEVELNIAEVAVLQARAALTQAIMLDEGDSQETAERKKARELLGQAGKELVGVQKKLAEKLMALPEPTTPAEKAQKARLEQTELQARFNIAMNYFNQAQSYARLGDRKLLLERGDRVAECVKALEEFVGLPPTNPIKWNALAWLGRCLHEQGELVKARQRFAEVLSISGRTPAAYEAGRLAQYFRLLVIDEKPEAGEKQQELIENGATLWLRSYPRLVNTPEGCGVRYLLAKYVINRAAAAKTEKDKTTYLAHARRILTSIEATENDFTDRARRKKIQIIREQGGFTKDIAELKTFEDCYVRSQYEQYEMEKEAEKLKETELEAARKKRLETICAVLDRGLKMPDAKDKANIHEVNNARTMLAFYYLNEKKYDDCIRIGENFARNDPRTGQAIKAAAYALQAYSQKEKDPESLKKMVDFATYCKERWKKELPGNLARHQLALVHLAGGKAEEVITELEGLTLDYPAYAATQLLLVDTASNLSRADVDKAAFYRGKMMAALERVKEPASDDGRQMQAYFLIRCRLADEMFNAKDYPRMEAIAGPLEKTLPTVTFEEDKAKNGEMQTYFGNRLAMIHAYSAFGRANEAMGKNELPKVGEILDPIVNGIIAKKMDVLKSNINLANAILNLEMRASIQQGALDRTRKAVQAFQTLNDEGGDIPPVLRQLVGLIRTQVEDLQKKGNEAALDKAKTGFSAILDDLTKKQKTVNPEFQLLLSACYTSMALYDKSVEVLQKIPAPPAETPEEDRAVKIYREAQIQTIRAQRLAKKFEDANAAMKVIMGDKDKVGWGRKNLGALKEQTYLYLDQEDFASANSVASQVSGALAKPAERGDARIQAEYIEAYYNMVYSLVRLGTSQKSAAERKRVLENAAKAVSDLEKRYPEFGGPVKAKQFRDLLASDPEIQKAYDDLKK